MGRLLTVATCSLNQWALDWEGNLERIKQSIREAKARGAALRVGPELEICGYGCLDHFLEDDLYLHCWEMLLAVLTDGACHGILLDIGMPVRHGPNRFNCRIVALNGKILLIRPKAHLANGGNYQEARYFTAWGRQARVEEYRLPSIVADVQRGHTVPIGEAVISTRDACISMRAYSELLARDAFTLPLGLGGLNIFAVSAAHHHVLRDFPARAKQLQKAARRTGGIHLHANQKGCDGDCLYYDGGAMVVAANGEVVAQSARFSLRDVEVVTAVIEVEGHAAASYRLPPLAAPEHARIQIDFALCCGHTGISVATPSRRPELRFYKPEEEIAMGPACWLWDYLRRSKAAGFLVPLGGSIDSCSTATIVFSMCRMVVVALQDGNAQVRADVLRIVGSGARLPRSPQELCNHILHTLYMGVTSRSSDEMRSRAQRLAERIDAHHTETSIGEVCGAERELLSRHGGSASRLGRDGGSGVEGRALENMQARIRMVTACYFAQVLPTFRGRSEHGLLVLGSANADECLQGNLTKHDGSGADLNPIGSLSKAEVRRFVSWAQVAFALPVLGEFLDAMPTAETDRAHEALFTLAKLRKEAGLGPVSVFQRLLRDWRARKSPREIADAVKRFYRCYSANRHEMAAAAPAYHAARYNPDGRRFDLRPTLYPPFEHSRECKLIDEAARSSEREERGL